MGEWMDGGVDGRGLLDNVNCVMDGQVTGRWIDP